MRSGVDNPGPMEWLAYIGSVTVMAALFFVILFQG